MSVSCSLVVTCWIRADLLVLLYVTFSCAFVTFQYGVLGQAWYLIVLVPDLCLLTYYKIALSSINTIVNTDRQQRQITTVGTHISH